MGCLGSGLVTSGPSGEHLQSGRGAYSADTFCSSHNLVALSIQHRDDKYFPSGPAPLDP